MSYLASWLADDGFWKLVTLIVAGFAVYIARQQFLLARERFKLDLFEKRFAVFAGARKMLSILLQQGRLTIEQLFDFRASIQEAEFLFDKDMTDYLWELDRKALHFHTCNEQTRTGRTFENRDKVLDDEYKTLGWLTDQLPKLKERFMPYMRFDTWK